MHCRRLQRKEYSGIEYTIIYGDKYLCSCGINTAFYLLGGKKDTSYEVMVQSQSFNTMSFSNQWLIES